MKKLTLLVMAASSIALLAGCRSSKADWTEAEKKIFSDYLVAESLPIYDKGNLTATFDEANGIIVAVGNVATADDIKAYAEILTSKENGYVEDESLGEDVLELYDLAEARQFRKESEYVVSDVVVIGLDKKNENKLTVLATASWMTFGIDSLYSGSFFDYSKFVSQLMSYDELMEYNDQIFTYGNTIDDGSKDGKETFQAGDFVYPKEILSCEVLGITEYTYVFPFTMGNIYSEYFGVMMEYTYGGATSTDHASYLTDLEKGGYTLAEAATEQNPYDSYKKESDLGTAYIDVWYDDEFFTSPTLSAMTINYSYIIK